MKGNKSDLKVYLELINLFSAIFATSNPSKELLSVQSCFNVLFKKFYSWFAF